jgi:trans-aconitate methyltransferase
MAASWDPTQYLRFSNERLRPALDLLAQVPLAAAARVVDLGCGAGNVTSILRERFQQAVVTGVEASHLRDVGFGAYYDLLRPLVTALDLWETTYLHVLQGEDPVVEWAAGSSLRPFLDKLPPDLREAYRTAYAEALRPHYPRRTDGTTLLPFDRQFILARR